MTVGIPLRPVHTNAFSFANAYIFLCFRLLSTLIRSKTEVYVCENGGFRKRFLEWRFLKTEVLHLVWTGENRGFRKRFHWVYLSANRFPATWENGIRTFAFVFRFLASLKNGIELPVFLVFCFCKTLENGI